MRKSVLVSLSLCLLSLSLSPSTAQLGEFGSDDRQEQERFQQVVEELCRNRPANEYFRLSTESNCRDAVRCVASDFKGGFSLAAVRCPTGLVFDLDGQTCDWASKVKCAGPDFWSLFQNKKCHNNEHVWQST